MKYVGAHAQAYQQYYEEHHNNVDGEDESEGALPDLMAPRTPRLVPRSHNMRMSRNIEDIDENEFLVELNSNEQDDNIVEEEDPFSVLRQLADVVDEHGLQHASQAHKEAAQSGSTEVEPAIGTYTRGSGMCIPHSPHSLLLRCAHLFHSL